MAATAAAPRAAQVHVLSRTSNASFGQRFAVGGGAIAASFERRRADAAAADRDGAGGGQAKGEEEEEEEEEEDIGKLLMPMKLLAFGKKAALDPTVSQKMAAKFKADRQAMTEVLERRKPFERQKHAVTAADKTYLELMPPAPKREPKHKDLASPALTTIVDKIRPPDYDDFVAGLRKHTQAAVLHASKPAAPTPSGLSRSSYLQVKRLKLERDIGEEGKFDVTGAFLQPSGDSPIRHPKRIQPKAAVDEPPPSGWVAFS